MGRGILICGLNGCGKSTLGRALADRLGFHFIDNEDLYFPKSDPNYLYASPRKKEEAMQYLSEIINTHDNFVFASVRGDWGDEILSRYSYAVLLEVPKDIRRERIRARSYAKFGDRMCEGGDLFETEQAFFAMAEERAENYASDWVKTLTCPRISLDGTRPVEENINMIMDFINKNNI